MKKSFLKRLGNMSIVYKTDNTSEVNDRIYSLAMEKINAQTGRNNIRKNKTATIKRPVILAAAIAIITMMGVTAAAYYYYANVSDTFKDVLNEITPSGEIVPLSAQTPNAVVEKSGLVVDKSQTDGGIKVTARGVVGDGTSIKIMLDIETTDGSPLGLSESGEPDGRMMFGSVVMRTDETIDVPATAPVTDFRLLNPKPPEASDVPTFAAIGCGVNWSDCIPDGDKAEILFEINISGAETWDALIGQTLYIELDYLLHTGDLPMDYKESPYIVSDGHWSFAIPLDYESLARVIKFDGERQMKSVKTLSSELVISPYKISLRAVSEPSENDKRVIDPNATMEDRFYSPDKYEFEDIQAAITMKDGTTVITTSNGGMKSPECLELSFIPEVVIDPEQVESVEILGYVYK